MGKQQGRDWDHQRLELSMEDMQSCGLGLWGVVTLKARDELGTGAKSA